MDDSKPNSDLQQIEQSLLIDPKLDAEALSSRLSTIATALLNNMLLIINKQPWRLVEVEAYFTGGKHQDPFTHCHPDQSRLAHFYFHKTGNSFRGGTYKGLDITMGTPGESSGGFLIRAIEAVADGELVEGPCRVVDTILRLTTHSDLTTFVAHNANLHVAICADLHLKPSADLTPRQVLCGPRYGLTMRSASGAPFLMRPYRFTTMASQLAKQRVGFALWMYVQGEAKEDLAPLGLRPLEWKKCTEAFEQGKAMAPDRFMGVILKTNPLVAQAFGACHKLPLPTNKDNDSLPEEGRCPAAQPNANAALQPERPAKRKKSAK